MNLENMRVLEAVLALADCDDGDDKAYHACWERLRAACKDWLLPEDQQPKTVSRESIRRGLEAVAHLQAVGPLSTEELAQRMGIHLRTAQELVAAMRSADVPLQEMRCRSGYRIRYRLTGPQWHIPHQKRGPLVAFVQLQLWPEERKAQP